MPLWSNVLIGFFIFLLLFFIQLLVKAKHPLKNMVASMFRGVSTLIAVNIAGVFTGVSLPIGFLSLAIAAIVGIPGVTVMLIFNLFL